MDRLRIALIVSRFPAASETFISNQVAGLLERGHRVDVYADESGPHDRIPNTILADGVLERLRRPLPLSDAVRAGGTTIFRAPSKILADPRSWLSVFRHGPAMVLMAFRYAAAAAFRTERYDIVHAHFGPNGVKAVALRDARVLAGKIVVTFHGYDLSLHLRDRGTDVYEHLFDEVDLCLPVTEHWRDRLIEIGCDPRRVRVHRMGVDPKMLTCAPRPTIAGRSARLITIGRLVEKKGIEYAIRAAARVAAKREIDYTVVGDGPERERLESLIRQLEVNDRLRILGWRSPVEVRALLCSADIAVQPSITARDGDAEGLPVALMEAMASGLPVVTTVHSGIPELVADGEEGFLVPERDVDALADRILHLIERPDDALAMGMRGRRRIEDQHDEDVLIDQLVAIYRDILRP